VETEATDLEELINRYPGRCVTCGFLGKHAQPGSAPVTHFEVELSERWEGKLFEHRLEFIGPVATVPICFRGAYALGREALEAGAGIQERLESAKALALKDRECPKWFPYAPGLDPKEHLAGLAIQEAEERQQNFARQIEQERRDWEVKQEAERRSFEIKVSVVFGVFALAQIVVAIVQLIS